MPATPQFQFCTTSDGVRIAYAVFGVGPPLVFIRGWVSHLELDWEMPQRRAFYEEYAQRFRVVRFDKRGTGLSDRKVDDFSTAARVRGGTQPLRAVRTGGSVGLSGGRRGGRPAGLREEPSCRWCSRTCSGRRWTSGNLGSPRWDRRSIRSASVRSPRNSDQSACAFSPKRRLVACLDSMNRRPDRAAR